jgi:hypothetical protein
MDAPELEGVDWDWVLESAEALAEDAPLFSEARARIAAALAGTSGATFALRLALGVVGPGPAEDARALLVDVAARLGVGLPEAPVDPLPGLLHARFSDPESATELRFHEALARARGEERRLLLEKLQLARGCLHALGPRSRVVELGRPIPHGHVLLRADVVIDTLGATYLGRLLGRGEALHALERRMLPELADAQPLGRRLLLAHRGALAPPDRAWLGGLSTDALLHLPLEP